VKVTRLGEDDPATVFAKLSKLGIPLGRLYGLSLRRACRIVCLTEEIAALAGERGLGGKVLRLSNAVLPERIADLTVEERQAARADLGLPAKRPIVLFVGYLVRHKGVADLLRAWPDVVVAAGTGASRPLLVLAGPYEGRYRELDPAITHAALEAQAVGNVRLLGHVAGERMAALYAAADVFVLPSHAEGMPNSLLEALANDLPAVVTPIDGIRAAMLDRPDLVQWAEMADASSLAGALKAALTRRWPAGERSGFAQKHYGLSALAAQYELEYTRCLASTARAVGAN
jgi:glycosyltransferase involved in cell wall biosynthesis